MTSLSSSHMVLFLLILLIFSLVITFVILEAKPKNKESFVAYNKPKIYPFGGREPNSCPTCCGNIDWYLGPKLYKDYCPGDVPPAFEDTKAYNAYYSPREDTQAQNYYGKLQESFTNSNSFKKQNEECKEKGLKAAHNPDICVENGEINANCKCTDDLNNCKECYPPIKFSKYE